MPRTLSGLQTGEFDEVDILHTVHINGNPGGANQVLTSDGVNSNWNDIPSQLPAGLAGQVLTSAAGTNPSFSAIPSNQNQILTVDSNGPTFTNRSNLVGGNLLVDSVEWRTGKCGPLADESVWRVVWWVEHGRTKTARSIETEGSELRDDVS